MDKYTGTILESTPLLCIPTDPDELVVLLDVYSRDWTENLYFLEGLARRYGVEIDTELVIAKMVKLIGGLDG